MGVKFANSAYATLASSITSSSTSITLTTGQGARFPSLSGGDYFYATLIDTSNNLEIVKCTARSSDVLTVVRGQESTTARAYSTSDRIELRITAQGLIDAGAASLDGDRGDITVSSSGTVWSIDNLAVTDAKINSMAATKLTGTIAKARMFAGSVLQVVQYTYDGFASANGTGSAIEVISGNITPSATSSKILILFAATAGTSGYQPHAAWINRNDSQIGVNTNTGPSYETTSVQSNGSGYSGGDAISTASGVVLDSPATTSSTNYKLVVGTRTDSSQGIRANISWNYSSHSQGFQLPGVCSMTLLEIAG